MMAPVHGRADDARGVFARLALATGALVLLAASYFTAMTGSGVLLVAAIIGTIGVVIVLRRPAIGIYILMTAFLFTYPAALRGVGNLTINNVLGLLLVPLMLYEMIREGSWWVLRFKPLLLVLTILVSMTVSAHFYSNPGGEIIAQIAEEKVELSQRSQGPALFETRDAAAKLLTRFVFLVLFVFFIRTNRDLQVAVGIVIAALLATYFSVGTGQGSGGWGTGRLRSLGDAGGAVYAGRNPNKLAYFALLGLTLLWYGRRTIRRPIWYPLWAAVSALAFVMIPLTGSRSGLLNLLIFIMIVLLEGKFGYRKIVGLTSIAFVVVLQFAYDTSILTLLLPSQTAARLSNLAVHTEVVEEEGLEATGSAGGRFRTAEAAVNAWMSYPAFGVGIGNFESERAANDPYGVIGPPHNSYLWALAEGGLFVFAVYAWLFAWTLRRIHEIRWEYEARFGPMQLGWLVGAMRTVLLGFLFFSIFADMWYHDFFYIIMGLALSVIRVHDYYAETGRVPTSFQLGGPSKPFAAVVGSVPRAPVIPVPSGILKP